MFAYVLLRMLERYSKNKQFMFVRKQTAKRKQNKAQRDREDRDGVAPVPEEYENDSEDEDLPAHDEPSYAEHAFTFTKFEKRFATEGVCNTLLAYLQRYKELDADQLRRVVGLIHRQVVKAQAEGLYFQVSSLALFRNIMDSKLSLPAGDSSRDLIQLVTFIVRKFFKRLQEDPFLMIEALMPKSRGRWKELSSWEPDAEDMAGQRARIREQVSSHTNPCGLTSSSGPRSWTSSRSATCRRIRRSAHWSSTSLRTTRKTMSPGSSRYVHAPLWVRADSQIMELILAERREVILTTDGEDALDEDEPSEEARKKIQTYCKPEVVPCELTADLLPSDEKHLEATKEDSHFRLLLETVGFWNTESEPSEAEGAWVYPPSELPSFIEPMLQSLRDNLAFPPTDLGDMKTLVRRVYKRRAASDSGSDSEGGGESAQARPKRKRRRRNDGSPRPPRAPKAKEVQAYKSAAFIWDSDDDDEADAAFFAREAELRATMGKAGEDAENEVRAIMAGKTLRKPVGRPSASSPEDDSSDDEANVAFSPRRVLAMLDDETRETIRQAGAILANRANPDFVWRPSEDGFFDITDESADEWKETPFWGERSREPISHWDDWSDADSDLDDPDWRLWHRHIMREWAVQPEGRHPRDDPRWRGPWSQDDEDELRLRLAGQFWERPEGKDLEYLDNVRWEDTRRDILREAVGQPEALRNERWRPHVRIDWRGVWRFRDEEEFLLRREGIWDSDTEGRINRFEDPEDETEDKENQPPLGPKTAAEDGAEDADEPTPSPALRKPEPEVEAGGNDTEAEPVAKRRRVIESDDDDG